MKRNAFTMIELIFVIVVMGIIGKFGVEFLAQSYKTFIFSSINNKLHEDSGFAVEYIAARLQYRIKDSVIAKKLLASPSTSPDTVLVNQAGGEAYNVLEWVASDEEGFKGLSNGAVGALNLPNWSGIIDLYNPLSTTNTLLSPGTNTSDINTLINALSYGDTGISDSAIYSIGSTIGSSLNVIAAYGWSGALKQAGMMHPITNTANLNEFQSSVAGFNFSGSDISEYYKLSWTANAIEYVDNGEGSGTLTFYWDYQPWNGETTADAKSAVIMEHVSSFKFYAINNIIKIQVCTRSTIIEDYSLCKEKTIL